MYAKILMYERRIWCDWMKKKKGLCYLLVFIFEYFLRNCHESNICMNFRFIAAVYCHFFHQSVFTIIRWIDWTLLSEQIRFKVWHNFWFFFHVAIVLGMKVKTIVCYNWKPFLFVDIKIELGIVNMWTNLVHTSLM